MFWEISQNSQENTCTRVSILIKLQAQVISCACQETFKIQRGPLTCDSEKVLDQLKCKVCDEVPYVGKAKTKFRYRFNNYKSKYRAFGKGHPKVPQKLFHTHYCLDGHSGIEDWDFVIFLAMRNTCATERKRNIFAT